VDVLSEHTTLPTVCDGVGVSHLKCSVFVQFICLCLSIFICIRYFYHIFLSPALISLKEEVWVHQTSLTPPLIIEVPVPDQESERSCICVLEVSVLPLGTVCFLFWILELFRKCDIFFAFHCISSCSSCVSWSKFCDLILFIIAIEGPVHGPTLVPCSYLIYIINLLFWSWIKLKYYKSTSM
jgi:hypothetical protein